MPKYINEKQNLSLSELEWEPGELVAFDNNDFEYPQQFIMSFPTRIVRGFDKQSGGMRLIYKANEGEREEWTLHSDKFLLGLWSPTHDRKGRKIPSFDIIKVGYPHGNGYVVEEAMAGENEVIKNLLSKSSMGLDFYVEYFQKSKFRKLVDRISHGKNYFPNLLEFKK